MISALLAAAACLFAAASSPTERFADPAFALGFQLSSADHTKFAPEIGAMRAGSNGPAPAWRLAQWGTRFLLEPRPLPDARRWSVDNAGKRVALESDAAGGATLMLAAHGAEEYGGRMRAFGEAWPHLLVEQRFPQPIHLADSDLAFSVEFRVDRCAVAPWARDALNPGLHTAQASAFWTVHNRTPSSPDHNDMIWFGIPLFDARHDIPPAHYALDVGKADATGKFICLLDGARFWAEPTGNGKWHTLKVDLIPLFREALAIAQAHGHLRHTRFEDLAITSFNLGWELPGPYDAALTVRGLSLLGR